MLAVELLLLFFICAQSYPQNNVPLFYPPGFQPKIGPLNPQLSTGDWIDLDRGKSTVSPVNYFHDHPQVIRSDDGSVVYILPETSRIRTRRDQEDTIDEILRLFDQLDAQSRAIPSVSLPYGNGFGGFNYNPMFANPPLFGFPFGVPQFPPPPLPFFPRPFPPPSPKPFYQEHSHPLFRGRGGPLIAGLADPPPSSTYQKMQSSPHGPSLVSPTRKQFVPMRPVIGHNGFKIGPPPMSKHLPPRFKSLRPPVNQMQRKQGEVLPKRKIKHVRRSRSESSLQVSHSSRNRREVRH